MKYFVLEDQPSAIGHEYQLIDDERHADAKIGPHRQTAALYDVLPAENRPLRAGRPVESEPGGLERHDRRALPERDEACCSTSSTARRSAPPSRRASSRTSRGSASCRTDSSCCRITATACGTATSRSVGFPPPARRAPQAAAKGVQVVADESGKRVDITIDGKPFTSYIYPESLKKPVLYPIRTAGGTLVTRGFPLDPRPRERFDHPHHVGLWFNHGDVNGLDFWNNSYDIPADRAPKMGTIHHKRVVEAKGGADRGELAVEMEWNTAEGVALAPRNDALHLPRRR